jgi:hypothetical protein
VNNHAVYDEKQGSFRAKQRFDIKGQSDAIAVKDSKVWFIEFKAAKGKMSEYQKAFQKALERHGHSYLLIRSLEELKSALTSSQLML